MGPIAAGRSECQPGILFGAIGQYPRASEALTRIDELGIADRTFLIFLTDTGTACGARFDTGLDGLPEAGFNADMRGHKSSAFDGGHWVPLFVRWPGGSLGGPRDIGDLGTPIDILPTLVDLCGLDRPAGPRFDSLSLAKLMRRGAALPARRLFSQIHGAQDLQARAIAGRGRRS